MPTPNLTVAVPPELAAARAELGILHDIFAALGNGQIRALEHERAKKTLDYIQALIDDAQARHDLLLPPEATQAPANEAPPAIASKEPAPPVAG